MVSIVFLPLLKRSCPAVSHICNLTTEPPTFTILEPNSTPMVCELSSLSMVGEEKQVKLFYLKFQHKVAASGMKRSNQIDLENNSYICSR